MNQRNVQSQQHPESYIHMGNQPNFPQSNGHQNLPTSGSIRSQYPHHQMHPVPNLELGLGIPTPSNFYYPHLNLASGPSSHNHMVQMPSSSNFVAIANGSGNGMNDYAHEGFQGLSKIDGSEGFMGNMQYFNAHSAPTVSVPPMNVIDGGVAIFDACNPMPQYRENYVGPFFHPPAAAWCERQPNGVGDRSNLPFNRPQIPPYFEASSVNGNFSELGNIGAQRFHEGASTSQASLNFLPYTPIPRPLNNIHPQNTQGGRRYNVNYHPPTATTSSRRPINNTVQYAARSRPQQAPERVAPPHGTGVSRSHRSRPQQAPERVAPPHGTGISRSHRRSVTPGSVDRHRNLPHLRLHPEEDVAIFESDTYDVHFTDFEMRFDYYAMDMQLNDMYEMQLDTDYMSYEELLALSERIGNVKTGLSEEDINTHLNTRVRVPSLGTTDLCSDDKEDSCVICQDEYEDNDDIGSLDCGHEYHVDCLKKWLQVKNECAICKATALKVEHKSG